MKPHEDNTENVPCIPKSPRVTRTRVAAGSPGAGIGNAGIDDIRVMRRRRLLPAAEGCFQVIVATHLMASDATARAACSDCAIITVVSGRDCVTWKCLGSRMAHEKYELWGSSAAARSEPRPNQPNSEAAFIRLRP
eukprot:353005-Chlamydomonas_euryale.AAC.7